VEAGELILIGRKPGGGTNLTSGVSDYLELCSVR
jgi:hypothetical protein